jgi:hypothetical protein
MGVSHDLVAGVISFILTLMILSYLIGDSPIFRVAVYIFVGASAGYAASVAFWQILVPRMFDPIINGDFTPRAVALVSLLFGVLLMMKLSPRTANLGTPVIATLAGVGAAVAVGGAVIGTLFPQIAASVNAFGQSQSESPLAHIGKAVLMLIGTVTTLAYFHYGAKAVPGGSQRSKLIVGLGWVGQIFIAVTLGALFAGVFTSALTALIERLNFFGEFLKQIATFLHL